MTGRSLAGVAVLAAVVAAVVLSAGFGLASAAPGEVTITFTAQPPAITNSNKATFEFTIDPPNASWNCRLDGTLVSCPQLEYETQNPLPDGEHTFTVNATAPSAEPASAASATKPHMIRSTSASGTRVTKKGLRVGCC